MEELSINKPDLKSQLLGNDDPFDQDLSKFIGETLQDFINMRNLDSPYYGFTSLTDKWNEYDRCYEVRAKDDRQAYEYQGFSNIVLPDFNEKIELLRTRELNTFFSGAELFETKSRKYSTEEDAMLGKKLVKFNFDCIEDFRQEVGQLSKDKLLYGSFIAYTPYTVDETKQKTVVDYIVDVDTGNPILIDGMFQKTVPYEANIIREKKYTDLKYINLKKVYLHPRIKDIQDQVAVIIQTEKTSQDLINMEADGYIAQGKADYAMTNFQEIRDPDVDASDKQKSNDDTEDEEIKVYEIYIGYCHFEDNIYEIVFMGDGDLLGYKLFKEDRLPFIMGQHITQDGAYGLGVGDQIYPVYIAKCARFNQVFDLSTFEIKGGGFVDSVTIPDFKQMIPGEFKKVVGLSAMLSQQGKPTYTWAEMRGARPSSTGLEVVGMLDMAMQSGSGATALLGGMPTQSQVDKTASGIEATIEESNARINAYLENFEETFFKEFAIICYENYKEHLDPKEDLPLILDPEDYTYIDSETGDETMVKFPEVLQDVDFSFIAVKRVLESEKQIGKIQRFLGIMGNILGVAPEFGQMMLQTVDMKYLVEEIARSVDITDLDKLFPSVNLPQELINTQKELQAVSAENQMMNGVIQASMQKLEQMGEKSALDAINNTVEEVMGQQGQQGPQGGQGGPQ